MRVYNAWVDPVPLFTDEQQRRGLTEADWKQAHERIVEAVRVTKAKREFDDLKRKARDKNKRDVQAPLACFGLEVVA